MDAGNSDVRNVLAVSFLENLAGGDAYDAIRSALGPPHRAEVDAMASEYTGNMGNTYPRVSVPARSLIRARSRCVQGGLAS